MPRLISHLESLTGEGLRDFQLARLRSVLSAMSGRGDFWEHRLKRSGLAVENMSLEDFTAFPLTSKADLLADQQASPPLGSRFLDVTGQPLNVYETSGTSGLGQEAIALTAPEVERRMTMYGYVYCWAGLVPGDKVMLTLPISMQSGGQTYWTGATGYGLTCLATGTYDARKKVDLLRRYDVNAVLVTPTYLNRLEVVARELGLDPAVDFPALTNVFTFAEPYAESWPQHVRDAWGVSLVSEQWGLAQAGVVTATCEAGSLLRDDGRRPMMHVLGSHTYLEVIDPETEEHVPPGEWGEMVVTRLFTEDNPMVRFRTGDRGRFLPAGHCGCGRPFDGIECGTVGRFDDMMKIRGLNVYPDAVDSVVFEHGVVEEYAGRVDVDQQGNETVTINVDCGNKLETMSAEQVDAMLGRLRADIKQRVGINVAVVTAAPYSIPRFEFKARRWTDSRRTGRNVIAYAEAGPGAGSGS
jgi:phenylacetate-CoA ligase